MKLFLLIAMFIFSIAHACYSQLQIDYNISAGTCPFYFGVLGTTPLYLLENSITFTKQFDKTFFSFGIGNNTSFALSKKRENSEILIARGQIVFLIIPINFGIRFNKSRLSIATTLNSGIYSSTSTIIRSETTNELLNVDNSFNFYCFMLIIPQVGLRYERKITHNFSLHSTLNINVLQLYFSNVEIGCKIRLNE